MVILLIISLWLLINTWISLFIGIYEQEMVDKFDIPMLIICSIFSYPIVYVVDWAYVSVCNKIMNNKISKQ